MGGGSGCARCRRPRPAVGGRWRDNRQVVNGVTWPDRTGAPWRDVPQRYGHGRRATSYERFVRWAVDLAIRGRAIGLLARVRNGDLPTGMTGAKRRRHQLQTQPRGQRPGGVGACQRRSRRRRRIPLRQWPAAAVAAVERKQGRRHLPVWTCRLRVARQAEPAAQDSPIGDAQPIWG
jgi:hypothetical protein